MARARPSSAAVKNVIEALIACGMAPGAIHTKPDGSFIVEAKESSESRVTAVQDGPRKFGQPR